MQTETMPQPRPMPNDITKLAMGLLVLMLTLLLILTAITPIISRLLVDDRCEVAAEGSFDSFSAETAVPNCWLVQ